MVALARLDGEAFLLGPLRRAGVVSQVLAEVPVPSPVADRLPRRQVQLVLVVEHGMVVLVRVGVPAVSLVVSPRICLRVVRVLPEALVLMIVVVGWDGREVRRVQRRGRAVRFPPVVLLHDSVAILTRRGRRPLGP